VRVKKREGTFLTFHFLLFTELERLPMLLKYFYDPHLAQASYMIGCQETGEALVIDPARDITPYLQAVASEGLRLAHVTETHIHADFVSGVRELVAATGARLYLSDMGDANWKYAFANQRTVPLRDGDKFKVGNIKVDVIHTPGHTPEHVIFQITDTLMADRPMGLFSGDCLFVGNVGRPDLLEEAAGLAGTKEIGARGQFANIQHLKNMPDYLQIWPGHGAGSACGKGVGAVPTTTLGYEKLFNPAFQIADESQFVTWLLDGQPEIPRYFGQMKRVNKAGPALLSSLGAPRQLADKSVLQSMVNDFLVIDTRRPDLFAASHFPGTVNIPAGENSFSTWIGWYVDYTAPTYVIADEADMPRIVSQLRAIGIDNIPGYFTPDVLPKNGDTIAQISPQEADQLLREQNAYLLDVRGADEYYDRHIPDAHLMPMGRVLGCLDELPRDLLLIVQCGSGVRSQVVASLLQRRGFTNVSNLKGGIDAWENAGLPIE
jgi:hydroxyacylglutathione hydrolase